MEEQAVNNGNETNENGGGGEEVQMKNRFEAALQRWYEIGLGQVQQRLDKEGIEIVENQKSALQSRKELASRTKEFRKLSDQDKLANFKGLLKGYQAEIDSLTRNCKCAENYFLNIYKLLAEAPDPYPLLENTLDNYITTSKVVQLEQENNDLKAKLGDYNDIKQRLEDQQKQHEDQIKTLNNQFDAILQEKQDNWSRQESMLQNMVEESRQQLKQVSQVSLLGQQDNNNSTEDDVGSNAELELLAQDLQRANQCVSQLENRNLELRKQIEQGRHNDDSNTNSHHEEELNQKIQDLNQEISSLCRQYEKTITDLNNDKRQLNGQIKVIQQEINRTSQEAKSLKEKIASQQDYNEIKRELEILKIMEFSQDDDDDDDGQQQEQEQSLEHLLLGRNNKLVAQLAGLREAYDELVKSFDDLKQNHQTMQVELKATKENAKQMESDLLNIDSKTIVAGSIRGGGSSSRWGGTSRLSPTSSIIGGGGGGEAGLSSSASDSLLPIITHQRDRFRQRNNELEQEVKENFQKISQLGAQVERLRQENVNLIQQSHYKASYHRGGGGASTSTSNNVQRNYYEEEYENQLSPFAKFQTREHQRAFSSLSPVQRVIYTFSKIILASSSSRTLFAFYCLALHILIMVMLWYFISTSSTISQLPTTPNNPKMHGGK